MESAASTLDSNTDESVRPVGPQSVGLDMLSEAIGLPTNRPQGLLSPDADEREHAPSGVATRYKPGRSSGNDSQTPAPAAGGVARGRPVHRR